MARCVYVCVCVGLCVCVQVDGQQRLTSRHLLPRVKAIHKRRQSGNNARDSSSEKRQFESYVPHGLFGGSENSYHHELQAGRQLLPLWVSCETAKMSAQGRRAAKGPEERACGRGAARGAAAAWPLRWRRISAESIHQRCALTRLPIFSSQLHH